MSVRHLLPCALLALLAAPARAQTFTSGSNGSDGALICPNTPGVTYLFQNDLRAAFGPGDPANNRTIDQDNDRVYHFTTIVVPTGVTLRLSAGMLGEGHALVWLASGDVRIDGTLNLNGDNSPDQSPAPGMGGAGGYSGGRGAQFGQAGQPGNGPGGGRGPNATQQGEAAVHLTGDRAYGNPFLLPLIGGSGGAGAGFAGGGGTGGGGGGGAILIASSTTIEVNGLIGAQGGNGGGFSFNVGGRGSGGAVRLVATTIRGGVNSGVLTVDGRVRLEALQFPTPTRPTISGDGSRGAPNPLFLGAAGPGIRITSVAGVPVAPSPTGSFLLPDVTIQATTAVPVTLVTSGIPDGTVLQLTFQSETGSTSTASSTPLVVDAGTGAGAATCQVTFPSGHTRVFVTATWAP